MVLERDILQPSDTEAVKTYSSKKELFNDILNSAKNGHKRDLSRDMREFLRLDGLSMEINSYAQFDPEKPLIITPNHYSAPNLGTGTTEDSFRAISVSQTAVEDTALNGRKSSWVVKHLKVSRIPTPFNLVRNVQNATGAVYDFIPVGNGSNKMEFAKKSLKALKENRNIGLFPEGKPTRKLSAPHTDIPNVLNFFRAKLGGEIQLQPVSIVVEKDIARVTLGNTLFAGPNTDLHSLIHESMREVARHLPPGLRGNYA